MSWTRRIWNVLTPGQTSHDIRRELDFHIAERVDQLRADGLTEAEAWRRARLQFGSRTAQAEHIREVDTARWLDTGHRYLRQACRSLRRTPGFTAAVVLTLALGIGANAAVFSAVHAILLQPLPFPEADRLVRLAERHVGVENVPIAPVRLAEWQQDASTFDAITGYYVEDVSETSGDVPEQIRRALVAPRFFDVWGVHPAIGRGFSHDEHHVGGRTAVVISHRFWQTRLGAHPDVLAQTVRIGTRAYPIIGVMPADFRFADRAVDMWFPVFIDAPAAQVRQATWYEGVGRLAPWVTVDQARANLASVQARLAARHPETDADIGVVVEPLTDRAVVDVQGSLWLVFGSVTVLLLVACTNVAALLLSRATARRHEMAVRASLGASRATVAAHLLIEAAVLAATGGAVGILVAWGASTLLRHASLDIPRADEIAIDHWVLLYTFGTAAAVTLVCGLLPALHSARGNSAGALRDSMRTQVTSGGRAQWALVGAQIALSVALLTVAGLLGRSMGELSRVTPGFNAENVLTFRMSASWAETNDRARLQQRVEDTLDVLRSLPGVLEAASTAALPGLPTQWEATVTLVEGQSHVGGRPTSEVRYVSASYFDVLHVARPDGEMCPAGEQRLVVVNRAFATRYVPGRSPVGLHLEMDGAIVRIAGVVGDVRERGLDQPHGPVVYRCASAPNPTPYFLVRTEGDPMAAAGSIRLAMRDIEPGRSVYDMAALQDRIDGVFARDRVRATLLLLFAVAALALAGIGVYGTLSYVVGLRRREAGLRLALGASRRAIVGQFVTRGLRVVVPACALGMLLSAGAARTISGMLFGIAALDPTTFVAVPVVVCAFATLMALVPSIRAARVEPMRVLREQ